MLLGEAAVDELLDVVTGIKLDDVIAEGVDETLDDVMAATVEEMLDDVAMILEEGSTNEVVVNLVVVDVVVGFLENRKSDFVPSRKRKRHVHKC